MNPTTRLRWCGVFEGVGILAILKAWRKTALGRVFARFSEIATVGSLAQGFGLAPDFWKSFSDPKFFPTYLTVIIGLSLLWDIIELATSPEQRGKPCQESEPELPLGEEP